MCVCVCLYIAMARKKAAKLAMMAEKKIMIVMMSLLERCTSCVVTAIKHYTIYSMEVAMMVGLL